MFAGYSDIEFKRMQDGRRIHFPRLPNLSGLVFRSNGER
jgi:hypothetical protein